MTGRYDVVPPKKKSKLPWILGGIGALVVLCLGGVVLIGVTAEPDAKQPAAGNVAADVKTDTPAQAAAEQPQVETKVEAPKAKDFKLTVKTLKKQCFGSAGCLVDFRIQVAFNGDPLSLNASKTYEVTYEVKGAEDPITNTFTMTGDSAEVQQEESTQTPKSSSKLTAVVTDVTEL
jgi:hypothetical protein